MMKKLGVQWITRMGGSSDEDVHLRKVSVANRIILVGAC